MSVGLWASSAVSDGQLVLFDQSVPLAEGGTYAPPTSLDRDAIALAVAGKRPRFRKR